MQKLVLRSKLSFLPNLFTLGNLFFGFCSIVYSTKEDFYVAAVFIYLGALMDSLDGRIARLLGISSEFGLQLDSLADAVSFCLAPAILVYCWYLKDFAFIGLLISSLFLITGLIRLARFNIIHEKQTIFFLGMPTTIAGTFLITFLLNFKDYDQSFNFLLILSFLVILLSFLMVSRISFPTFKKKLFNLNKNIYFIIFIILAAIFMVLQILKFLFLIFCLYFSYAFLLNIKKIFQKSS